MQLNHQSGFKLCTIGSRSVGKTALVQRYVSGVFSEAPLPTIESVLSTKTHSFDGKTIKFNIWDTAGQERYKSTVPLYLRDAHCVLLIFDLSKIDTFDVAKEWCENESLELQKKPLFVLVGNKLDLISGSEENIDDPFKKWAGERGIEYFMVSSQSGKGIKELFNFISKTLFEMFPLDYAESQSNMALNKSKRSGCPC